MTALLAACSIEPSLRQSSRLAFGDLTFEESARSVDLLAREVMPALQGFEICIPAGDFPQG